MPQPSKLNNSLFEIVLPEFATVAELPQELNQIATASPAAVLRSRTWQSVIELLSLPVTAPVLKLTTP